MSEQRIFHGSRLRLARAFRGKTLAEVGDQLLVSRQFVQQLENGVRKPNEEILDALVDFLGFKRTFFERPLPLEIEIGACSFRSRRRTTQSMRNRLAAYATLFSDLLEYLKGYVHLPVARYPKIQGSPRDIESLAVQCRLELGLDKDAPISNVTRALERSGVVITMFHGASADGIDALSVQDPTPFIVRNTRKQSPSRARFDLAHEFAHLVMHQPQETGSVAAEKEADRFASAFLLPRDAFLAQSRSVGPPGWRALFQLKRRWGVSIGAIVHRGHDLGVIDSLQYRRLNVHIRKRGWHVGEPQEPLDERPEVVPLAFEQLRTSLRLEESDVADALGFDEEIIERLSSVAVDDSDAPHASILPIDALRKRKQDRGG